MKIKELLILITISFLISIICLGIGSIHIDPIISIKIFFNNFIYNIFPMSWDNMLNIILLDVRLPRIILGFVTGGSLAIIGVLMQTLTKNNLAEPYILGISSGASFGACSVIILTHIPFFRYFTVSQGAFIGALISIIIVFLISLDKFSSNSIKLVLIGIGVSSFFMALTMFIIYGSKNNSQIITAMFWMTGSLASTTLDIIFIPSILSIIILFLTILFSRELDILLLGENFATSIGINILYLKIFIILVSTLLISCIVSLTGIIGFVGLIIPHITRKIVGHNHINLLPFSYLFGGIFLVITDTFARTIFSPEELPIGIITAFCGAPLFLWIIRNNYEIGR